MGVNMNEKMIIYILGWIMKIEAIFLAIPLLLSIFTQDGAFAAFLFTMIILLILGIGMSLKKPKNHTIYAKEGFVIVGLSWIILSIFGAFPFYLSRQIPNFVDCLFETVSGFTTTGATILENIEGLSASMLFWRAFTHWFGGMGVLVFILAIIPLAGGRSIHLLRAEAPGPTVGKFGPKLKSTARMLYGIYVVLTFLEVIFLVIGRMPLFDSIIHALSTAGTGGFSLKNASIAYYDSAYIDGVITVFMILFAINFNIFYLVLVGEIKNALKSEELRWFLAIIGASVVMITCNIVEQYGAWSKAFRYASFQVASVISSTGFITADFNKWPELSKLILILLMFVGACAGSTGGGLKISRVVIMLKTVHHEIKRLIHPNYVDVVRFEQKPVDPIVTKSVGVYFIAYMFIIAFSALCVAVDDFGFETTITSVLTCLNNIGPALGKIGPTDNFFSFSPFSKIVLIFDMLIGRLEIFPILILLSPSLWVQGKSGNIFRRFAHKKSTE